jgi:hypothetical protein
MIPTRTAGRQGLVAIRGTLVRRFSLRKRCNEHQISLVLVGTHLRFENPAVQRAGCRDRLGETTYPACETRPSGRGYWVECKSPLFSIFSAIACGGVSSISPPLLEKAAPHSMLAGSYPPCCTHMTPISKTPWDPARRGWPNARRPRGPSAWWSW